MRNSVCLRWLGFSNRKRCCALFHDEDEGRVRARAPICIENKSAEERDNTKSLDN